MEKIKTILLRYLRGEASPEEIRELNAWAEESVAYQTLLTELTDPDQLEAALASISSLREDEFLARFERYAAMQRAARGIDFTAPAHVRHLKFRRVAIAAAVILLTGIGIWWMIQTRKPSTPAVVATAPADVQAPAGNRATLTLANGQTVYLDAAGNGQLATQGTAMVQKQGNGQIAYVPRGTITGEVLYNTLTNPRGSQVITLTLSDGTRVWLNAASSIHYPAVFTTADRLVQITGEAYLEIAKDQNKPFRVTVDGATIDVLGTSFDINSYSDEPATRVTLIGGKVKVTKGNVLMLAAGEQAVVGGGVTLAPTNPDLEAVLAWKNGRFTFSHADLETVLRQLSRWYDVDVHYKGKMPDRQFTGRIGRSLTLSQVLQGLAQEHIHYTIEGNQLTIHP